MGTAIQMAGSSTGGTQDALAQIDCPMNGELIGIEWNANADMDVTADDQLWQLSFGSTSTVANDSRQVISNLNMGGYVHLTAVGAVVGQANLYVSLPNIPVGMGERLFLHSIAAAGVVGRVLAVLHFTFDLDKVQVRRR